MTEINNKTELPCYIGGIHPNCDYHHGQIYPVKGVKCYQAVRANREYPELADHTSSTYKHAPDLAYFHGKFYIQYLCNPRDEHTGAGYSVLAQTSDISKWEDFRISFPEYRIPACEIDDYKGNHHRFGGNSYAFMHQRMAFYRSSKDRMLVLGFYGWSPQKWMTNWDNYGIGRVVRELYPDGSMGEIYFIRPNFQAGWSLTQLNYPMYTACRDEGFVKACEELLSNRLYVQQWAEENGDADELIQIKHPGNQKTYQAFCWYHIDENDIIGLWKHSLAARSFDNGEHWSRVTMCPSLVMSGQKIWGQKTSDGRFALVYDPTLETQHRYPLCIVTSGDGIHFDRMRLIHGEVPMMRYEGFWKDFGPQYVRGMSEGITTGSDNPGASMYVTYSVNKEDIWVAEIPVPVKDEDSECITEHIHDAKASDTMLENWNLYCPKWALAGLADSPYGTALRIYDAEPADYCKAERLLKPSKKAEIILRIMAEKTEKPLYIEVCNAKAQPAVRLVLRPNGRLYARTVTELEVCSYEVGKIYEISLRIDCSTFSYTIAVDGIPVRDSENNIAVWRFMGAAEEISRVILRTGGVRNLPDLETDPEKLKDLPVESIPLKETIYQMYSFEYRPEEQSIFCH